MYFKSSDLTCHSPTNWGFKSLFAHSPKTLLPLNRLSKFTRIAVKLKSTFMLLATMTVSFMYLGKWIFVWTCVVTFSGKQNKILVLQNGRCYLFCVTIASCVVCTYSGIVLRHQRQPVATITSCLWDRILILLWLWV